MPIKYLVFPGTVASKNDGDLHFISSRELMRLYGVSPAECKTINSDRDLRGINDREKYINLRPSYDGDYKLPEKTSK